MKIESAIDALSALAQEHRLALFRLLVEAGDKGMRAGSIADALGVPNSSRPAKRFNSVLSYFTAIRLSSRATGQLSFRPRSAFPTTSTRVKTASSTSTSVAVRTELTGMRRSKRRLAKLSWRI